jgi:hypothetical protein
MIEPNLTSSDPVSGHETPVSDNSSDHLLTPKEAAAFLRMPVKAVLEEIRRKRLGCYMLSHKRILISMGHIRVFLEGIEMTGTVPSNSHQHSSILADSTSSHSPVDKSPINPVRSPQRGGVKNLKGQRRAGNRLGLIELNFERS